MIYFSSPQCLKELDYRDRFSPRVGLTTGPKLDCWGWLDWINITVMEGQIAPVAVSPAIPLLCGATQGDDEPAV